jgi:alkylhydroperoxidase family enzyme
MAWIDTVNPDDAEGALKREYDAAVKRAGHVAGILRIMSLNPPVLSASLRMYRDVMFRESPLSRAQREMLATVVSVFNQCHY